MKYESFLCYQKDAITQRSVWRFIRLLLGISRRLSIFLMSPSGAQWGMMHHHQQPEAIADIHSADEDCQLILGPISRGRERDGVTVQNN